MRFKTSFYKHAFLLVGFFLQGIVNVKAQEDTLQIRDTGNIALVVVDSVKISTDTLIKTDSLPNYYRINGRYLKTFPQDLKQVVTAPLRWKGRDWLKFGIIGTGTGLLMVAGDQEARKVFVNNQTQTLNDFSKVMYPFGNRLPPLLLAGFYATSVVTKNRRLEHVTLAATKSLAISTIIYTSSKTLIRRQRPTRTDDPLNFVAPFTKKGYTSFPSGHANTAFSVATAFAMHYKDVKWVPWVAYTLASLTAVSRLYDDRHWMSDVVLGASIGHFVTRAIYKLDEKRQNAGRADLKTW